jgi:hypothetical protein
MLWAGVSAVFTVVAVAVLLLPAVFYILTVRRALHQCAAESRAMPVEPFRNVTQGHIVKPFEM